MAEKNLGEFLTSALAGRRPSDLLLYRVENGSRRVTSGEVERQVRELTVGLLAYGAEPDARVAVVSGNRPEALIATLAIHAYGGTVVPIEAEAGTAYLARSLAATGARLVLVGPRQLARVLEARPDLPLLDLVLLFERPEQECAVASALLDSARALGAARLGEDPSLFEAALRGARGGGGTWLPPPDGGAERDLLVLTAENLLEGTGALESGLDVGAGDVVLSLLPVTRAAHRTIQFAALRRGAMLAFASSLEDLAVLRPTIVIAERSLVEALAGQLLAEVEARRWPGGAVVRWALRGGVRRIRADLGAGRSPAPRGADRLPLRGLRRRLVGGKLRFLVSVGPPLDAATVEILEASGVPVLQGYDLDAAAGMIAMETPRERKAATVGRPLAGVEWRIAGNGTLQVRGPMVGRPVDPAIETDGWLETGRSARIQEGGWLVPLS